MGNQILEELITFASELLAVGQILWLSGRKTNFFFSRLAR